MSWGAIAGATIGAIGSIIGGNSANNANQSINDANIEFQREMSNTAVQRRVEDMRKAGINPILAVSNAAGGASTPVGSSVQMQNPVPSNLADMLSNSAKRKLEGDLLEQQANLYDLNKKNLEADIKKKEMDINVANTIAELNSAEKLSVLENIKNATEQRQYIRAQTVAVLDSLTTARVNREWTQAKTDRERIGILKDALEARNIDAKTKKILLESENLNYIIRQNDLTTQGLELEINSMLNRGEFGQHTNWLFGNIGGIIGKVIK